MVIGIVAYNRLNSLLETLDLLLETNGITEIHVSLDFSKSQNEIIKNINSRDSGAIKLFVHSNPIRKGLKRNVYQLCDLLAENHDDFVIIEDDVKLEKSFVDFIVKIQDQTVENIRQISLYNLDWDEFNRRPLIHPCYLNHLYLSQIPASIAVYYKQSWWLEFKSMRDELECNPISLNSTADRWGEQSWKKTFFKFLVTKNYFSLIPKGSYATHTGNKGTNNNTEYVIGFDTPLSIEKILGNIESFNVYDSTLLYLDKDSNWQGRYSQVKNFPTKNKMILNYPVIDLFYMLLKKVWSKI